MFDIKDVVAQNVCVGCGACNVATSGAIPVTMNEFGHYQANLEGVDEATVAAANRVCPFSDASRNEDQIAERTFPMLTSRDERLGRYISTSVGRVEQNEYLIGSSSGGMTSFVAHRLLERREVDGVIHVGAADGPLFGYQVSYTAEELLSNRKSMYYSTTFADALLSISGDGRRYAFIGVPCFVRAARLVCEQDAQLSSQLRYFLGLVCGHLKSAAFAESLAWQSGVKPHEIEAVDFRIKLEGRPSSDYAFGVRAKGADELLSRPMREMVGANWGHGFFQLNSCNYCDDIFAETADVAFGDAWLDQYKADWRGTNVIVNRSPVIEDILEESRRRGHIFREPVSLDAAAQSQAGNFRHRRDGLSVRLADDAREGKKSPRKRVAPGSRPVTGKRVELIRQRRLMSARSHELFHLARINDSLDLFVSGMQPLIEQYRRIERDNLITRLTRRAHRMIRRLILRNA